MSRFVVDASVKPGMAVIVVDLTTGETACHVTDQAGFRRLHDIRAIPLLLEEMDEAERAAIRDELTRPMGTGVLL